MNAIQQFVKFKYETPDLFRERQLNDLDRFEDFPIDMVIEGELKKAYIQDVYSESFQEDGQSKYKNGVILIDEDGQGWESEMVCISPCDELDWLNIICPFQIKKLGIV